MCVAKIQFRLRIFSINESVTEEQLDYYVAVFLLYFSSVFRDFTEDELRRKIKELGGKGEAIMAILERRGKKGLKKDMKKALMIQKLKLRTSF